MTTATRGSEETPHLRWFDELNRCACGKPSTGILRGVGNTSFGPHCRQCALRRLKASEKALAALRSAPLNMKGE